MRKTIAMSGDEIKIRPRVIGALYTEAMLLADEARSYFSHGRYDVHMAQAAPAIDQVAMSCESLKVTTRLMHVIAWLLSQRAAIENPADAAAAQAASRPLGHTPESCAENLTTLADDARLLIKQSENIYNRVLRLQQLFADENKQKFGVSKPLFLKAETSANLVNHADQSWPQQHPVGDMLDLLTSHF